MMDGMEMKVYKGGSFEKWFRKMDANGAVKVMSSMKKVQAGNMAECKPLQGGVSEVRNHSGPGYRVYYGMDQGNMVILGGSLKKDQDRAISAAVRSWNEFKAQKPEVRLKQTVPFRMK